MTTHYSITYTDKNGETKQFGLKEYVVLSHCQNTAAGLASSEILRKHFFDIKVWKHCTGEESVVLATYNRNFED